MPGVHRWPGVLTDRRKIAAGGPADLRRPGRPLVRCASGSDRDAHLGFPLPLPRLGGGDEGVRRPSPRPRPGPSRRRPPSSSASPPASAAMALRWAKASVTKSMAALSPLSSAGALRREHDSDRVEEHRRRAGELAVGRSACEPSASVAPPTLGATILTVAPAASAAVAQRRDRLAVRAVGHEDADLAALQRVLHLADELQRRRRPRSPWVALPPAAPRAAGRAPARRRPARRAPRRRGAGGRPWPRGCARAPPWRARRPAPRRGASAPAASGSRRTGAPGCSGRRSSRRARAPSRRSRRPRMKRTRPRPPRAASRPPSPQASWARSSRGPWAAASACGRRAGGCRTGTWAR